MCTLLEKKLKQPSFRLVRISSTEKAWLLIHFCKEGYHRKLVPCVISSSQKFLSANTNAILKKALLSLMSKVHRKLSNIQPTLV